NGNDQVISLQLLSREPRHVGRCDGRDSAQAVVDLAQPAVAGIVAVGGIERTELVVGQPVRGAISRPTPLSEWLTPNNGRRHQNRWSDQTRGRTAFRPSGLSG